MPRIRLFAFRLAPHSRLTHGILIGDEIFTKVGGHVLTSVIPDTGGAIPAAWTPVEPDERAV
jgi:hypothetical protein